MEEAPGTRRADVGNPLA